MLMSGVKLPDAQGVPQKMTWCCSGAMLTNDNFFRGVIGIVDQWRFTDDSVNLAMMPLFHIAGAGWS